jgi:hypothetical protein
MTLRSRPRSEEMDAPRELPISSPPASTEMRYACFGRTMRSRSILIWSKSGTTVVSMEKANTAVFILLGWNIISSLALLPRGDTK